jgi:hypothetical protein
MNRSVPGSCIAALAVFAILFQAVLFGWHHHEPILAGHLPAAVVENHPASPQALGDEDRCEICQVLHHLFAAPVSFAAVLPALLPAAAQVAGEQSLPTRSREFAFHARAPPLA